MSLQSRRLSETRLRGRALASTHKGLSLNPSTRKRKKGPKVKDPVTKQNILYLSLLWAWDSWDQWQPVWHWVGWGVRYPGGRGGWLSGLEAACNFLSKLNLVMFVKVRFSQRAKRLFQYVENSLTIYCQSEYKLKSSFTRWEKTELQHLTPVWTGFLSCPWMTFLIYYFYSCPIRGDHL